MDSRPRRGPESTRRAGGIAVRHGGYMAGLEADGRKSARHRPHQRFPYHVIQYSNAGMGRGALEAVRRSAGDAARSEKLGRDIRHGERGGHGCAYRGNRGGPAGRSVRAGVLGKGGGEKYLRHGVLSADERGLREAGQQKRTAGHRRCDGEGGKGELRARRQRVYRRGGDTVASGRDALFHGEPRRGILRAEGDGHGRRVYRARVYGDRSALLGHVRPRRDFRAYAGHQTRTYHQGRPGIDRLSVGRSRRGHGKGHGRCAEGPESGRRGFPRRLSHAVSGGYLK